MFLFLPFFLFSQEKTVNVERCKALDQTSPIHNIWVDEENIKWVANTNGLNKVLDLNTVEKVPVASDMTSLLMIRGGNAQMEWNTNAMKLLIGNVNISCASYNPKTKTVWLGTYDSGAIEVSIDPLRIVQRLHTGNKKLTSDQINDIFIRNNGTIFIATNDGMLTGSGEKWTLQERYLNFIGVDAWEDNVWILGDDFLWQVDSKGKWSPIAIELRNVEGQMRDIAVDDEGRVWIASNMMTGYDVNAEKYQRFGPGQYFTSQFVNCLDVDQDGSIWTGTADKGLYLIQWESSLILSINQDNPLECLNDKPTAVLSVKVGGGTAPYTYKWNNGQTTSKASQLTAGEYEVTVTDVNGLTKTAKYSVEDPSITISVVQVKQSSGNPQGDASADIAVIGGTGQFIYAWDNGEFTPTAVKLTSGTHTVTVTDKPGCSAVATINITENISPLAVSIKTIRENKCKGAPDGEIKANVTGGKSPYKYSWNFNGLSTSTLTAIGGGAYSITVTDAAGQTASSSISLLDPPGLSAQVQITVPANANAANGQALAKPVGGKAPYTYLWSTGETSALNKSLAAGQNIITVTDANGCESVAIINMTENIEELNATIIQSGEIKCHSAGNVDLSVDIKGGKGPYQYTWSGGQKTEEIKQLTAGNYLVTVTDATGKNVIASKEVKQPAPITVSIQTDGIASANNSDGRATAKAIGGSGTYKFTWDSGESTNKAVKLSAGRHLVTVTDESGCTATGDVEISENVLALQVSVAQIAEINCANDAAAAVKAVVTGGKGPYTYKWSNQSSTASISSVKEGLFTLTVSDVTGHTATTAITIDAPAPLVLKVVAETAATTNGSNARASATVSGGKEKYSFLWDNGEKTNRAEKLNAGNHSVTVTDENGCTIAGSVEISENILPLAVSITQSQQIVCSGKKTATLVAEAKGGKEPFKYAWSDGSQSSTITNVGAGSYSVTLTDATGKTFTSQQLVTQPASLIVETYLVAPASTGNTNGEVSLKISGGTLPYSFRNSTLANTANVIKVDNLSPGLHNVSITDAAGCSVETSFTVTENIIPLTATVRETNAVQCSGNANASLIAEAKGGKPPYQFTWNNGSQGASLTNVAPGNYTLVVTDATGQETKTAWAVKSPPPFTVDIVNLRSATNDRISDGKGSIQIKGGSAPYTYNWSSGETTLQAAKLPLGQGRIIVTDQNGCTTSAEFVVKEKVLAELTAERLASGEPIRMEKIQFKADSVNIEPEAIPSLNELYEFLYDNPTVIIEIAGHTNSLPADDYCDRISAQRAKSVADYLTGKGIENRRVISKGYGKRKPIAPNQTPEGRKKNQRVEIRLIKIEE